MSEQKRKILTKRQFNDSFEKAPTETKRIVIDLLAVDLKRKIKTLHKELEQLERIADELEEQ